MKDYLSADGERRLWYEQDEIEQIFEGELRRSRLMPRASDPVTDLERFIEGHLKVTLDQYAELPEGVLGLTTFRANRPTIAISADLTAAAEQDQPAPGAVGRWRATLAHEAAHVVLHRYLFDPAMTWSSSSLPPSTGQGSALFRCSNVDPVPDGALGRTRTRSDWREVQANRGMAALLMPRPIFRRVVLQHSALVSTTTATGAADKDELIVRLAAACQVSKQAAAIRLDSLGLT